jgi:hypothetical protein
MVHMPGYAGLDGGWPGYQRAYIKKMEKFVKN